MPIPTSRKTIKKYEPRCLSTPSSTRHTHPRKTLWSPHTSLRHTPLVEARDAAIQAQEGEHLYIRLLAADYMLYGVYQDWFHQNPGDHLDREIAEYSKWKAQWKNSFVCQPNSTTHLPGKVGKIFVGILYVELDGV